MFKAMLPSASDKEIDQLLEAIQEEVGMRAEFDSVHLEKVETYEHEED